MKGLSLAIILMIMTPVSIASGDRNMPDSSRYEVCMIEGKAVMMQPHMCDAVGGKRGG